MVDRNSSDWFGLGKPEVYGDTSLSFRRKLLSSPKGYTAAVWAKVKLQSFAADVWLRCPGDHDSFVLKVVDPKHPVAATRGAVAGRSALRQNAMRPVPRDGTAVTRAMKHSILLSVHGSALH